MLLSVWLVLPLDIVAPLVVPVAGMSLAGWVLLLGRVPTELLGWAGGDDCGLAVPFTVGVVPGVVCAEAAVTLRVRAAAKANTVFIVPGLFRRYRAVARS